MARNETFEELMEEVLEAMKEGNPLVLTYNNMEKVTLRYHKTFGIMSDQLQDTLAQMHADGWRFDEEVLRCGIPQAYYHQFTAKVHGKTIYTAEYIRNMCVQPEWA
jgi:PHD/YefM family antitoxin component YafN of YafNO toxin-antitoxin module